ncbi:MAG: hypothetical protein JO283_16880 [Bradyrhizobium sp.]|nr:hypothetical protein [Bradyrhizobium sp.]
MIDARVRHNRECRLHTEVSDEYGEPPEHSSLRFREQLVTPIQHRVEGLLTRWRGALSRPEHGQALIE